jgi:hypothetical protein
MLRTPAGLTSSVTADDKKYILQTEFLPSPEPRVVTTVDYKGQVIHKVEKVFHQTWDTPDGMADAEKLIKTQHISVARAIASRPRDFGARPMEIQVSPEDRLRLIYGIAEVNEVYNEMTVDRSKATQNNDPILKNISLIKDVVMTLSQNSRLGKLKRAVGFTGNQKFVLTGFGGKTFLLGLKPDVDISRVLNELEAASI